MRTLEELDAVLQSGLRAWESGIVERHAARMGQKIVREVKRGTNVVSGNLRRRWFSHVEKRSQDTNIIISNDADYAPYVNNGHRIVRGGRTVGMAAGKHMLENGIMLYRENYLADDVRTMLDELKGALR
jgi:hypothetical protein